ncbi:MAG: nucleotidyltransferase domain-containing protein [Nitrososphaeria archaeon]
MLKFHMDILKEFEDVGRRAKVILFGSLAKGCYRLDSDIDLANITNGKNNDLIELASSIADKILMDHGKVVSLKFIKEEEMLRGKSPLIDEIKRGIVIYDGGKRVHKDSNKRGA